MALALTTLFFEGEANNSKKIAGCKPSSKSLDQGVIAEVVEHNKKGRYPSDKTSGGYLPPLPNSYCVVYSFIYLYLLKEPLHVSDYQRGKTQGRPTLYRGHQHWVRPASPQHMGLSPIRSLENDVREPFSIHPLF